MPKQLTAAEREVISQMRFTSATEAEIADALGRHRSRIYRELKRNGATGIYSAIQAQSLAQKPKAERPLETKISRTEVHHRVRKNLTSYWSPEQIAGRMKLEGLACRDRVSRSTIERWIRQDPSRKHWEGFLRRRGTRRPKDDRRGKLPATASITGRPEAAEDRRRCGDWEGDTIVSPGKRSGLVCITDRKSGLLKLNKVKSLKSKTVIAKMREQIKGISEPLRSTMMLDNGKEFAQHSRLTAMLCKLKSITYASMAMPSD